MSGTREDGAKEGRLSIRANERQKATLARAAQARHMNVSQFVLQVSLQVAEEIVREEAVLRISAEEYEWLARTMDEARPAPRLAQALATKPVWNA